MEDAGKGMQYMEATEHSSHQQSLNQDKNQGGKELSFAEPKLLFGQCQQECWMSRFFGSFQS